MAIWTIDALHSDIGFKVKYLVVTNVSGKFKSFEGKLISDKDDFSDAQISFSADVDSIDTGVEKRDGHLKSADFFNIDNHPKVTFVSTSVINKGDEHLVTGNLTIGSVTKHIDFKAEYNGITVGTKGQTVAGFELSGKISRKEFGLNWNMATEAGGIVVGDEVKLEANIQLVKED